MKKILVAAFLALFAVSAHAGSPGSPRDNSGSPTSPAVGNGPSSVATAPQFDDSTKPANTHWVQQRGEQGSGMVLTSTSGNVTLANAGGRIAMAADGVNVVYTMPLLSSMPDHVPFGLWNVTSPDAGGTGSIFTVTIQTQGDDVISGPGVQSGGTVIIPPLGSIWLQRETIDMGEGPQTIYLVLGDKGSMGLVGGVAGHHYKSLIDYTDQNVTISANQVGSTIRLRHAGGGGQAILPLLSTVEEQSVIKIVSVNCPADMSAVNNVAVHDPVGDETDRIVYSNNSSAASDNLQCGDWEEFTANVSQGTWTALGGPNSMFYSTFWNTPVFENNPRVLGQTTSGAVVVQPSAFGQYSVTNDPGPFHTISTESINQFASDATIFNSQGVQLVGHHYGTWNPIGGGGNIDEATAGAVNLIADGGNDYALPNGSNYAPGQAYVFTSAAAGNSLSSSGNIRVGTHIISNIPLGLYDTAETVANGDGYSLVGGSALFPYADYFQHQLIKSLVVGSPSGGDCGTGCINASDVRMNNATVASTFQPTFDGFVTINTSSGGDTLVLLARPSDETTRIEMYNDDKSVFQGGIYADATGMHFQINSGNGGKIDTTGNLRPGPDTNANIETNACGDNVQGALTGFSNNQSGTLAMGTALVPSLTLCTMAFSPAFDAAPRSCVLFPANAAAATQNTATYVSAISNSHLQIAGVALDGTIWQYQCF